MNLHFRVSLHLPEDMRNPLKDINSQQMTGCSESFKPLFTVNDLGDKTSTECHF